MRFFECSCHFSGLHRNHLRSSTVTNYHRPAAHPHLASKTWDFSAHRCWLQFDPQKTKREVCYWDFQESSSAWLWKKLWNLFCSTVMLPAARTPGGSNDLPILSHLPQESPQLGIESEWQSFVLHSRSSFWKGAFWLYYIMRVVELAIELMWFVGSHKRRFETQRSQRDPAMECGNKLFRWHMTSL